MTRDLLIDLAILFRTEADHALTGDRKTGAKPDYDEADRLDTIADELGERAEGRAA